MKGIRFFREMLDLKGEEREKMRETSTTSKTPCAFTAADVTVAPGASVTVTSVYGRAVSQAQYDDVIKNRVTEVCACARASLGRGAETCARQSERK